MAFTPGVLAFTRVVTADGIGEQLGASEVSTVPGQILDADIYFNPGDSNTTFATPLTLSANPKSYLESILTHELGHFLGFSHSAVWSAMMFPYAHMPGTFSTPRPSTQQPDALLSDDDRTGLRVLYADPSDLLHTGASPDTFCQPILFRFLSLRRTSLEFLARMLSPWTRRAARYLPERLAAGVVSPPAQRSSMAATSFRNCPWVTAISSTLSCSTASLTHRKWLTRCKLCAATPRPTLPGRFDSAASYPQSIRNLPLELGRVRRARQKDLQAFSFRYQPATLAKAILRQKVSPAPGMRQISDAAVASQPLAKPLARNAKPPRK